MRVVLGTFARTGIEALLGSDIAEGVRMALNHYCTRHRESELESLVLAGLCRELPAAGPGDDLEIAVAPEIEEALESRAREWGGISVEQLAAHGVLAYLADVDRASGRETRSPVLL